MSLRTQQLAVLIFWLTAMSWLVVTKLMPISRGDQRPDHRLVGPGTDRFPPLAVWQIDCDGQPVGMASTTIQRPVDGTPTVRSVVHLHKFPLGRVLGKLVGTWPYLARSIGLHGEALDLSLRIDTVMHFSQFGELQTMLSEVDIDPYERFLQVRGTLIRNDKFQVIVSTSQEFPIERSGRARSDGELMRQDFYVPPGALIIDGFTPHPRLANLRVGQKWTMQSFRPFSPTHALRRTHAKVLRQELVHWDREMESMYVVALQDDTPTGLTATQSASVLLWVRTNGMVVRQQLRLSGLRINFRRVADRLLNHTEGFDPSIPGGIHPDRHDGRGARVLGRPTDGTARVERDRAPGRVVQAAWARHSQRIVLAMRWPGARPERN